ncbi:MAG: hypothetical protein ACHBN1_15220 [Heteroscytonema crispum UTEX LB 1556]
MVHNSWFTSAAKRGGSPLGGFADLKELPWFPRHLRPLGRPQDRSGGPFTIGEARRVHG